MRRMTAGGDSRLLDDYGQAASLWNLLRHAPHWGTYVIAGTMVRRSVGLRTQFLRHAESQTDIPAHLVQVVSAVKAIAKGPALPGGFFLARAVLHASREYRWFAMLEQDPSPRNCVLFGADIVQSAQRCRRFVVICDSAQQLSEPLRSIAEAVHVTAKSLEPEIARPVSGEPAVNARHPNPKRTATIFVVLGAVVLGGSFLFLKIAERTSWHTVVTLTGEQRRLALPDGTAVHLNTQSVLRYRFSDTMRAVELRSGEAWFRVTHEARPFVLLANDTSIRDIGTEFSARVYENGNVETRVAQGAIGFGYWQPSGSLQTLWSGPELPVRYTVRVAEGYIANNDRGQLSVLSVGAAEIERRDAWRQGKLSFIGIALGGAVSEFNRYNHNKIEIVDAALQSVVLSGGDYTARDPERFLSALLHVNPVRISVVDSRSGAGLVYKLRQATGPLDNPLFGARLDEVALAFNLCNERPQLVVEGAARSASVRLPIDLDQPDEFIKALTKSRVVQIRRDGDRVFITSNAPQTPGAARN
jgi:transmembrane sensor